MAGKREQIIQAALVQYRSHSICATTLKDVAEAAQMPIGNLYHYFKSREALVLAVLDECGRELDALLARLDPLAPAAWLAAYFDWLVQDVETRQVLSCPFGSLATELRALGDPAVQRAAGIVARYRAAVATRMRILGAPDPDAVFLTVQGAYTVAAILGDPALFRRSVEGLRSETLT